MSISRYFNKAKSSEVFISVANEEKEKTVNNMDLTRNEFRNVKSQLEKAESLGSKNRKLYAKWMLEQRAKIRERAQNMEFQVL